MKALAAFLLAAMLLASTLPGAKAVCCEPLCLKWVSCLQTKLTL